MFSTNLQTLKIHKLTQEQYERELNAGRIDSNALYLTEDKEQDLSYYATKAELANYAQKTDLESLETTSAAQAKLVEAKAYADGKAPMVHSHDSAYDVKGAANTALENAKTYVGEAIKNFITSSAVDSKISSHNVNTSAHNDIRTLITTLTNRFNALANSDDETLDQLSEIVAYIKSNKNLIDSVTTSKVNVSDIINNLTTNVSNKPLSAAQGVEIKRLIDILQDELDSLESTVDGKADENHGHSNATATTSGFMSADDKILLDKYRTDNLGSFGGKTIPELKTAIDNWISIVYNTPNASACFSGDIGKIVEYWNSEDTTSTIPYGATITINLSALSIYMDASKYALLTLTSYYDKAVYYVALSNGVWSQIRRVIFADDAVSKASSILETVANPTDGRTYHIPFHAGVSTSYQSLYTNDGIKYYTREGTASAGGTAQLGLGNNIPTGTAGNKNGSIYLYGTSSGYTDIIPTNNTTSNSVIYLPSSSGTLALTKDFLPITGGTVNGHIYTQHPTGGETNIGVQHTGGKLYLYGNNSDGTRGIWDTTRGGVISVTNTSATFIGNLSGNANSATYSGHIIRNDGNTTAKLSYLDAGKTSLGWGIRMTDANSKHSYLYLTANAENEAPWMRLIGADGNTYTDVLTKDNYYHWAAPEKHTHKYAGSSSAGGSATSAVKLDSSAGSATQPVYFSGGKPVATTYTLGKSVPSNAKFTDTTYSAATSSALGLVKIGSNITNSSGTISLTKANVTSALGYTPPTTNTTYSAATQSAQGLMSAADKKKLDGIATGANAYSLPTASSSTLGGVKTSSTVTSTSGLTACPIINGIPYYKDTNTTYSLSSFGLKATATELNYCDGVTGNIQTQLSGKVEDFNGEAYNLTIAGESQIIYDIHMNNGVRFCAKSLNDKSTSLIYLSTGDNVLINHSASTNRDVRNVYTYVPWNDSKAAAYGIYGVANGNQSKTNTLVKTGYNTSNVAYINIPPIYNGTTSDAANVFVSSAGKLSRSTSASKYKLNIALINEEDIYPYNILKLNPKQWHDKASIERYSELLTREVSGEVLNEDDLIEKDTINIDTRYGLIAEDVEAAGLDKYCSYELDIENNTKKLEGIQYDRVATLLIPVVRDLVLYTQKTAKYIHVDEMSEDDCDEIANLLTRINSFKESEVIK